MSLYTPLGPPTERTVQSNYGLGRRFYKGTVSRSGCIYLEVEPA